MGDTLRSNHLRSNHREQAALSSRDQTTKSIAVRLPSDLASAVAVACEQQGITASELLRALVAQWAYGQSQLAGPDAGYEQARSMASQLAHAALRQALTKLPTSYNEARSMLEGYYAEQANRRKR